MPVMAVKMGAIPRIPSEGMGRRKMRFNINFKNTRHFFSFLSDFFRLLSLFHHYCKRQSPPSLFFCAILSGKKITTGEKFFAPAVKPRIGVYSREE
jgi:hypothetical protein